MPELYGFRCQVSGVSLAEGLETGNHIDKSSFALY